MFYRSDLLSQAYYLVVLGMLDALIRRGFPGLNPLCQSDSFEMVAAVKKQGAASLWLGRSEHHLPKQEAFTSMFQL